MAKPIEIKVPDLGGSTDVPVIELLVAVGDLIANDQGLATLESDKATMELPSSAAGVLVEWKIKVGDTVSPGQVIAMLEAVEAAEAMVASPAAANPATAADSPAAKLPAPAAVTPTATSPDSAPSGQAPGLSAAPTAPVAPAIGTTQASVPAGLAGVAALADDSSSDIHCQLVVIGGGPGGYTAAFRAADLGLDVVLVERYPQLGGVCLNVGCIPSKALLHAAEVIEEARHAASYGVSFGEARIDLDKLRGHKDKVVGNMASGLAGLALQRKVRVLNGSASFLSPQQLAVAGDGGSKTLRFEQCVIAVGSQPVKLPGFPWDDPRVMDSTDALMLADVPEQMLVVGGGIIGLEMACIYAALGSRVTVVEFMDRLMPGADADLVKPLAAILGKRGVAIHLKTKVASVVAREDGLHASFDGDKAPAVSRYDRVLVSVGRTPNGGRINAEAAGVTVSDRGFITVDAQMRSNVPHIFAIGDVVGQPMLAHKATHEGKLAAEVAAGQKREWVARVIPSVAYTDPEIAWVGVTENEAQQKQLDVGVARFPWAASGRAVGLGRTEGFSKLIFDNATHRVIGGGIVGVHAGELIAEIALAIEMGCEAGDIGHTIHPHPTLSESVGMTAEVFEGSITDLYIPRKK